MESGKEGMEVVMLRERVSEQKGAGTESIAPRRRGQHRAMGAVGHLGELLGQLG